VSGDQSGANRQERGQDRAVSSISFQFYVNGQQSWARGEYETYLQPGEAQEEAMMRATDNALTIAFETRDAFVNKRKEH
jgi:hypothetical protein